MSRPKNIKLREAIRAGYQAGLTPREIAARTGSTVGSVKVIAHNMGVNDTPRMAAAKRWSRRTGEPVEHHLHPDYESKVEARKVSRSLMRELGISVPNPEEAA